MVPPGIDFDLLRRWPDVEADNLQAYDATDRLLLDLSPRTGPIAVIGDRYGALALSLAADGVADVRCYQDSFVGRRALARNAERLGLEAFAAAPEPVQFGVESPKTGGSSTVEPRSTERDLPRIEEALAGARTVLWQLPKSLDEVREVSRLIAIHADPQVQVFAGSRIKYLTPSVNAALAESFFDVAPTRARQKSRIVLASTPREGLHPHGPSAGVDRDTGVELRALGGVFAGARLDLGTRFLASHLPTASVDGGRIVDLGSGNGALAILAGRAFAQAQVVATDSSLAAVRSTALSARANGASLAVCWDDAGSSLERASFDLVLLNPPFHAGGSISELVGARLISKAGRLLAPGGELWVVFNSHLSYRPALRSVGHTTQLARNPKFTLTRTVRD